MSALRVAYVAIYGIVGLICLVVTVSTDTGVWGPAGILSCALLIWLTLRNPGRAR
jgi:hypothetical protein